MNITFPEIPKSFDCMPDGFAEFVSIQKCDNMDASVMNIIYKDKPISIYFSNIAIREIIKRIMP